MPDVQISPDGQSSTYNYGATGTALSATELVDRALARMAKELDPFGAAANLLARWAEHDSSMSHLLPDAMLDLEAREKAQTKPEASKTKRATKGPRVGDFAFIASTLGPAFYVIRKIHVDSAGKLTALTLAPPQTSNAGQPVAIEKITGVFANTLNPQE